MKRIWILTGILVLLFAGTTVMAQPGTGSGYGGGPAGGGYGAPGDGTGRMPFMDELTEEQREAIHDLVTEMREDGATTEEIREAVHEQLEEWGIEVPEPGEGRGGMRPPFWDELTEEQQEELQAMIDEMREDGASREEIQTAIHEQLDEWGIELPEPGEGRGSRRPPFWSELTEEQQAELREMTSEMREDGTTRDEIRDAVHALLEEWGIDIPEPGEGRRTPPFWDDLTEEQRETLQDMISEMREDGATREEIREAVHEQLTEWGIELPEPGRRTPPYWDDLTEEQQNEIRELINEMREDGATREEIRDAVHDLLEDWGIEIPVGPGSGFGSGTGFGDGSCTGGLGSTPGAGSATPATPSYRNQLRQQIKTSASPSPAKASAAVEYTLEEDAYTTVSVFDSNGRLVKNIYAGNQDAGSHAVTWDGKDANGKGLNSGVYFVRIHSGAMAGTQKVILAK